VKKVIGSHNTLSYDSAKLSKALSHVIARALFLPFLVLISVKSLLILLLLFWVLVWDKSLPPAHKNDSAEAEGAEVLYVLKSQTFKTLLWRRWKILEDWKIKISTLWLFYDVAFLSSGILGLLEPGALQQFLSTGKFLAFEQIGPELLLLFAILLLVPLITCFLTLTLKDKTNRWMNTGVSIVYTAFEIVALVETLLAQLSAFVVLLEFSKVVIPALIVWYAWKSKQKV
jgi:hypothetical protein